MTEVVLETLRAEFSDAVDSAQITRIAVRLLLAAALGGALGYEREKSRVIQGIVTGVGFLGAGANIKHRSRETVHGLTTAAGVWMTAAIGVACGLGREMTAVISTALAFLVLIAVPHLLPGSGATGPEPPSADTER